MSSESNLREAKTIPSISYVEQFFKEIPTDNRFGSVNWKKIVPKTGGVSQTTLKWVMSSSTGFSKTILFHLNPS